MALYCYRCPSCGWEDEVFRPMSASNTVTNCRQCGAIMEKDITANLPHASADSYHTAIHSDSLCVNSDQVQEHRRLYPDVPLDAHNRPVFSNYRQHEAYMQARGVVKQPALHQKKGKKIA